MITMEFSRNFKRTVYERAIQDDEFRKGLLSEAMECLKNNEEGVAAILIQDYLKVTSSINL